MRIEFKLEPICTQNGSGFKLWGYEVLLRNPIPNIILFSVENPALDMFVFENALDFLIHKGKEKLNYTVNLQPSTFKVFGRDIKKLVSNVADKLNLFIELNETGGLIPKSYLKGLKVILDDFGQMESNLHRLLRYSPVGIKIEIDILEMLRKDAHTWISNLVETLKNNNQIVIGEKIETERELYVATEMGISYFQGRFIEKYID